MRNPWKWKGYAHVLMQILINLAFYGAFSYYIGILVLRPTLRVHLSANPIAVAIMLFAAVPSLFAIGLPRKRYEQIERYLNRPDAPSGEREELAQFYREHIKQAERGLMVGEKWLMYSSFANSFAYPRADLQRVIKEVYTESDGEGGQRTKRRLILRFVNDKQYASKGWNEIHGLESNIDRRIDCIRKTCADLPLSYERAVYDARDREQAEHLFRRFGCKRK